MLALALAGAGELDEAAQLAHEAVVERNSHTTERDHVWWGTKQLGPNGYRSSVSLWA